MTTPSLSLLAWAYNEEENVDRFLEVCSRALDATEVDYEIIVVDDASRDRTPELLKEAKSRFPRLKVIRHDVNRNVAGAFRSALDAARNDIVFWNTVDLSFDMSELPNFLARLGLDRVVVGVRRSRTDNYAAWRVGVSLLNTAQARFLFRMELSDVQGMHFYPRSFLQQTAHRFICSSPVLATEMLLRARLAGLPLVPVPLDYLPRERGTPKLRPYLSSLRRCAGDVARLWLAHRIRGSLLEAHDIEIVQGLQRQARLLSKFDLNLPESCV